MRARPSPACCPPTSTRWPARACTSSRSTTTWPSATPSGWAGCTGSSASTVGVILPNRPSAEHRAAYECDITYGTNNEFGFDYLRDNMAWSQGRAGAARPQLRDRRRGRLDPHRRGPYPADHLRPGRAVRPLVRRVRQGRQPPAARQGRRGRLRGRRGQADDRDHRARRRPGRGPARHRQPVRVGEHPAGRLPQQRDQGQGALQARQGLHRQRRRGPDRRRVHRPHPARPPLQRGHAPGDRGQGRRRDQAGEPDPGHDHPAELLPALRQALRHDRYGADRGRRVQQGLQASAWCRSRRTGR